MFETAVLSYGPASKRVWTTCLGMTGQCALVALAVLVPLISPTVLPKPQAIIDIIGPPAPPPPPPKVETASPAEVHIVPSQIRAGRLFEPIKIPTQVRIIEDPPEQAVGPYVVGSVPTGSGMGDPNSVIGSILSAARPPVVPRVIARPVEPVEPAAAAAPIPRIRISSVEQAIPIRKIDPIYPALAKTARISGVVKLEGVIGTDGRIKELKVLEGNPWLVRAALDAVSQWLYRPTMLNGEAVEVVAPIIVTFRLN